MTKAQAHNHLFEAQAALSKVDTFEAGLKHLERCEELCTIQDYREYCKRKGFADPTLKLLATENKHLRFMDICRPTGGNNDDSHTK